MSKMKWPPERTIKYTFNSLDKDFIEFNTELTDEKEYAKRGKNIAKTQSKQKEDNEKDA